MVIGPNDLEKLIEERNKPSTKEAERSIDRVLAHANEVGLHRVSYIHLHDLPQEYQEKLFAQYESVGWKIEYRPSLYEGNFYHFTDNRKYLKKVI